MNGKVQVGISLSHYLITTFQIHRPCHTRLSPARQSTLPRLLLVSGMSSLDTEVMSELAASLEGAIGVALQHCQPLLVPSMSCSTYTVVSLLLQLVLVGYMAALSTKLLGKFRALGKGAVGVTIGMRVLRCAVSLVWG
jgi:Flp pilus assembly pilin Flp